MLIIKEIQVVYFQMAPYLLFGLSVAGVLHVFFDRNFILRHLGKSDLASVVKAAILGVPIPLCSCGVIPTAVSLRKNGASKGATVSFLISTPQTGVDSVAATYGMMGPVFAIFRPLAAFLMGVVGGVFVNGLAKKDVCCDHEKSDVEAASNCKSCKVEAGIKKETLSFTQKLRKFVYYAYFEFLDDISVNLVVGVVLAGLIAFVVPVDFFETYIKNEFLSMIIMIVAGIPLYICATASIPVAVALMMKGLSPGAAFVFLAVGPATNAATMTMIFKELGRHVFIIYISVIAVLSIVAGYALNYVFSLVGKYDVIAMLHVHDSESSIWMLGLSWILLVLLIISLGKQIKNRFFKKKGCCHAC
jgi:uncharacterized protein